MAATARKESNIARQVSKAKPSDSTIAKLPQSTDTATVRAARAPGLKVGANFTGQYLYDRFVNDKAEAKNDVTKMGIVRQMVDAMDAAKFGQIVGEMVIWTQSEVSGAVRAAKEAGNYNSENPTLAIREANAHLKTARNHQTVMRAAFGALKFCADELKEKIGDAELSYRMIREIGSQLLADKGINWDGTKAAPKPTPQERQAKKDQEAETAAMLEIQKENPRKESETRAAYFARIDSMVGEKMAEKQAEQRKAVVEMLTKKVREMAGENLPDLIDMLLSAEPEQVAAVSEEIKTAPDVNLH